MRRGRAQLIVDLVALVAGLRPGILVDYMTVQPQALQRILTLLGPAIGSCQPGKPLKMLRKISDSLTSSTTSLQITLRRLVPNSRSETLSASYLGVCQTRPVQSTPVLPLFTFITLKSGPENL
jgi:hypothetical protein